MMMIPPALQLRGLPATAQVFGYNRDWPVMLVLHLPICSRVLIAHTAVSCLLLSRVCTAAQTHDACVQPLFTCVRVLNHYSHVFFLRLHAVFL